ncbi:4'-phosphopantetheinyl transferase family protein [Paenibacillus durus]|uniref:4'-phosphopantetheinyl transferase family protein n=1 Tax=Paenibacillus durus TaxID=44251 RepID=UPI0012E057D9|nr:4'-phosphopantetheinyl transferase superfamily protein [Paenibacillus durus]
MDDRIYNACLVITDFADISGKDAENTLHPQELSYYRQLTFPKKAQSYLIGRYAAKYAISSLLGNINVKYIRIENGFFGQPMIVGYPLERGVQVSISHSGLLGAAISFFEDCPTGVDIEVVNAANSSLLYKTISVREQELLVLLPIAQEVSLTLLWTAKEALSKAIRTGFTLDLEILEVKQIIVADSGYEVNFSHFPHFRVISHHYNDYIFSIAFPYKKDCEYSLTGWNDEKLMVIEGKGGGFV